MSLKPCHECQNQVSSDAKNCPACGAKQKRPVGVLGWSFAIILGVMTFQCTRPISQAQTTSQSNPAKIQENPDLAATAVVMFAKGILNDAKNPKSIEWANIIYIQAGNKEAEGAYCFEYRGTNSFNAIVLQQTAFYMDQKDTKKVGWNKYCAGKRGRDMKSIVKYSL